MSSRKKELDLSDLSNLTTGQLATMEAESYDEAMDSLTRSQRNKLLAGLPEKIREGSTSQSLRGAGFWRSLGYGLLKLTGLMVYWYGRLFMYFGELMQEGGESLARKR